MSHYIINGCIVQPVAEHYLRSANGCRLQRFRQMDGFTNPSTNPSKKGDASGESGMFSRHEISFRLLIEKVKPLPILLMLHQSRNMKEGKLHWLYQLYRRVALTTPWQFWQAFPSRSLAASQWRRGKRDSRFQGKVKKKKISLDSSWNARKKLPVLANCNPLDVGRQLDSNHFTSLIK